VVKKNIFGVEFAGLNAPSSRFAQINQWYLKTQRVFK